MKWGTARLQTNFVPPLLVPTPNAALAISNCQACDGVVALQISSDSTQRVFQETLLTLDSLSPATIRLVVIRSEALQNNLRRQAPIGSPIRVNTGEGHWGGTEACGDCMDSSLSARWRC